MPVANVTELRYDHLKDSNISQEEPPLLTFEEIVYLLIYILLVVAISADLFLIGVICRFKMLRIRTNMYILNCCIVHIPYIISPIVFPILYDNFHLFSCYRIYNVNTFLVLYVVFAFALGLDWFLSVSRPNIMQKYNTVYKYVFAALYIVFFIDGSVYLVICSAAHEEVRYYIFHAFCIISIIAVLILNIRRRRHLQNNSLETAYSLTVSNIIIVSFVPLAEFLEFLMYLFSDVGYILVSFIFIPLLIVIIHPVLVIYILGRQNKYFKIAYKRSFSCCIKNYADDNGPDDDIRDYSAIGFQGEEEPKLLQGINNGQIKEPNCGNTSTVNV